MSIALTLQLQPSKYLRYFRILTTLLVCVLAGLLAARKVGEFTPVLRWVMAFACVTLALAWLWHGEYCQATYQIAISGQGQIRLAKQKRDSSLAEKSFDVAQLAHILPSSSFWPGLLVLLLRTEDGKVHKLLLTQDSTSQFRALAVALRWLMHRTSGAGVS